MTMKVKDLISRLEERDPEADVLLATQENYPFEHSVRGVQVRENVAEDDDGDDGSAEDAGDGDGLANQSDTWNNRGNKNDVLLVEGGQLRYGNRNAWNL